MQRLLGSHIPALVPCSALICTILVTHQPACTLAPSLPPSCPPAAPLQACQKELNKLARAKRPDVLRPEVTTKKCRHCQQERPADQYFKSKMNLDGLYSYCKRWGGGFSGWNEQNEGGWVGGGLGQRQTEVWMLELLAGGGLEWVWEGKSVSRPQSRMRRAGTECLREAAAILGGEAGVWSCVDLTSCLGPLLGSFSLGYCCCAGPPTSGFCL